MKTDIRKLPTIADIVSGEVSTTKKQNDINVLLNQSPPATWVKKHPFAANVNYIPIDKIEYLLTSIFINWSVEIRQVQVIANSAVVTIRLHYQDAVTTEVRWQDGVGACAIQTDKGSGAMDWNATKSDAVMKAVPAAESYAVKDAAEKIGRIFGKDLNRKDVIGYESLLDSKRFENAKITEK
jgi:hypothetical protein